MNGKSGSLVTTGGTQEYVGSCQHMHSVAAVPAEVQLCLDATLCMKARGHGAHCIVRRH